MFLMLLATTAEPELVPVVCARGYRPCRVEGVDGGDVGRYVHAGGGVGAGCARFTGC